MIIHIQVNRDALPKETTATRSFELSPKLSERFIKIANINKRHVADIIAETIEHALSGKMGVSSDS